MKTSELTGAALDWAVAKCEQVDEYILYESFLTRYEDDECEEGVDYHYSTDWAQGGPIIEREGIVVDIRKEHGWVAAREFWYLQDAADHDLCSTGPTYLIAAMRCFVASKMGDEIDLPKELT